jgi:hypothetical protein
MTLPECRAALLAIAKERNIPEILPIVAEMKRRPYVRKVRPRSPAATEELRQRIRAYAEAHPQQSYMEIANEFGVGIGRVSEALAGFRD